jgi:hypothetical protein
MLQRIDSGAAEYDDPRLVQTTYGDILTLTAREPGAGESKSYYRWHSGRWLPLEARGWLRELARQLPKGEVIKAAAVWPDIDSMSAQARLYPPVGPGTSNAVAKVELSVAKDKFIVKKVTLTQATD